MTFRTLATVISLLFLANLTPSWALDLFEDEKVLFKSGNITYIALDTIERNTKEKNDHPQELREQDIKYALSAIKIWDEQYLESTEDLEPVFSPTEISKLSKYIAKGLDKAKKDQDIIFSVRSTKPKLLLLKQKFYTSGRAFFKDGKLNVIIGHYQYSLNDAFENILDPSGEANQTYRFDFASRFNRSNNTFKEQILKQAGVDNKVINRKVRKNWFVLDVEEAADSFLAEREAKKNPGLAADKQFQQEAAKLAKERREMRLEMARLRKEMKEGGSSSSSLTAEERLENLQQLKDKGLITDDEYAVKREEILNDI